MRAPASGRARRRVFRSAIVLLLLCASLFGLLPWAISLPSVQRHMAARANAILAPSSLEFGEIRVSWLRPTQISNFVLRDARGDALVEAPRATFRWNLWQMLIARPSTADLEIPSGELDITRGADGTVNLYETLRPVISERPAVRLSIRIDQARLKYRDPMFSDPVVADTARVVLDLGRNSEPITWDIGLARSLAGGKVARLAIVGSSSRAQVDSAGRHDLTLTLKGSRWPWTVSNSLVESRGELTGDLDGTVRMGRVRIAGDATLTNVVAIGGLLSADIVHVETVRARLKLDGHDNAWSIEKLELTSPVASFKGEGSIPPRPENGASLEGTVDLAAVAKQLPETLRLRHDLRVERGTAKLRAEARLNADGHTEEWNVTGLISDLAAGLGEKRLTLPDDATLAATLEHDRTTTKLNRLDVQSSFLTATGQGDVDRGIAVTAALDLAALRERLRDWVDVGPVQLDGQGKIDGLYQRQGPEYRASLTGSFRDLRVGALPLIEKIERDQLTIEGKLGGRSTASGWPVSWNELSVRASSGESTVQLSARTGTPPADLTVKVSGSTPVVVDGRRHRVEGKLSDKELRADDGVSLGAPGRVVFTANAAYAPRSDQLQLTELTVKAPNLRIDGSGVVHDATRHADIDLKGSLDLDWEAIRRALAGKVEPNASIAGRPRAWRLAGTIDGVRSFDRMGGLNGEIGAQIDSLDVLGIRLSAVPVVLRSADGQLTIDPIDATLNGGALRLEPKLVRGEDGSTWLHLGNKSKLNGAIVNDEVSHRVLSFAAPVLDGATRVEGQVSIKLADAYFPIAAPPGTQARIEGAVIFDEVRFMPGPLAQQLLGVFGRERRPLAVVRDTVSVRIDGRKVYQHGLSFPVANVASIGLDGSVDFDQNLEMVAHLALMASGADMPVVGSIIKNARFDLPITGTLKKPKIDGNALKQRFKGFGIDLLGNSVEAGAGELWKLLRGASAGGLRGLIPGTRKSAAPPAQGPATARNDPGDAPLDLAGAEPKHEVLKPATGAGDAPTPGMPEERSRVKQQRRQQRLQKKADRRLKKNGTPEP